MHISRRHCEILNCFHEQNEWLILQREERKDKELYINKQIMDEEIY